MLLPLPRLRQQSEALRVSTSSLTVGKGKVSIEYSPCCPSCPLRRGQEPAHGPRTPAPAHSAPCMSAWCLHRVCTSCGTLYAYTSSSEKQR